MTPFCDTFEFLLVELMFITALLQTLNRQLVCIISHFCFIWNMLVFLFFFQLEMMHTDTHTHTHF